VLIPYYSGGVLMALPYADSELAVRYIQRQKPDFVVLATHGTRDLMPYFEDWLTKGLPDRRAKLIYKVGNTPDERVVIYEWHDFTNPVEQSTAGFR
jgi:hypothetical protein